ncbi:hypothetical protein QQ045_010358 [Rhodiola kirilowii]
MAELSAAVALATAVAKLSQFLYGQARVGLLDVDDDIEGLMRELHWVQSFLKDAENMRYTNHLIQQWVSDATDLAYNCEDVIDTFFIELRDPNTNVGCLRAMSSCISYPTNLHSTTNLSRQLKKLQTKANDISGMRNRYDLNDNARSTVGNLIFPRRTTPYAYDEHMVGQAETIHLLTAELTNGRSGRFIISIAGMGGLGKTTLARKLYDQLGQQYFKSCAWICNPQVSDAPALLLQLIKSMIKPSKEDLESLDSIDSMESYLRNFLSGCRFLVVIDDVWKKEAWEILKRAFPNNNCESRVIITTRNMKVAAMNKAYVHELRYLDEDESWRLFCKKAFLDDNDMMINPRIKHVGREMVEKCLGLPLAIVTLGGLLSTKSSLYDWTWVRDNFWKQLEEEDSTHINALLLLSFRDLPYYLKPCFLYIGMFPENFEIPVSKLILLWVAEGFIGSEMGSPESVAKSYFDELVGRSLFQKNGEDWIGSTFTVHGLLRNLAIKEAKKICFSVYYDKEDMFDLTWAAPYKRLASFHPTFASLPSRYTNPSLRTLFIRSTGVTTRKDRHMHLDGPQFRIRSDEVLRSVHKRFGLLRVVDIQVHYGDNFKPQILPSEIGSLIHLRYLGFHLFKSAVKELPHTICNLKALQTISVKSDPILSYLTLPKNMGKLRSLRHLIGNFGLGHWIGKLIGLETLQEITYEQWCGIDTTNLANLHHLSLTSVPQLQDSPARFYEKFQTIKKLETFSLENPEIFELVSISVSEIFKCCPRITHFKSSGIKFEDSSDLHEFAVNLQVLDIVYFKNPENDPIPLIERLPALRALQMKYYSANTQNLVCSGEGFPELKILVIELDHNVTFSVAEGGMPKLTCLKTNAKDYQLEAPKRLKDLIINTES